MRAYSFAKYWVSGASYLWYLYDLKAQETLSIMETSLIVQDGAILNSARGMRLDKDTAFRYVFKSLKQWKKWAES